MYILSQETSCSQQDELDVSGRGSNNHRYLQHDQSQMSKHDQAKAMLPNATQI
jgi:hypothetical protein